jgi:hypothetical protein
MSRSSFSSRKRPSPRRSRSWREEGVQLLLLVHQVPVDRRQVVQQRDDVGRRALEVVGEVGEPAEVLPSAGISGVDLLQVAVDQLEVLADLVAAAAQAPGDAFSVVLTCCGLEGAQQRQQVVERLLGLARHLGAVLRDDVALGDRLADRRPRDDEVDVLLAEQRLGQQPRRDVARDEVDLVGVEREPHARRRRRWS